MSEGFGARLRDTRERQSISLRAIAEQTKIKMSLLEGLEGGDVSRWPGGIFRRAFVRAYAQAIGLEPDAVVREFLELYPDPGEVVAPTIDAPAGGDESVRPMARLRATIGAMLPSLSGVGRPVDAATVTPEPLREQPPQLPQLTAPACPVEGPSLAAIAQVCTALGRTGQTHDAVPLLPDIADVLDAAGLIIWAFDPAAEVLRPVLAHGYSSEVLAQVPAVDRDADNATAAAFRLTQTCVVKGANGTNGALAVPVLAAPGCAGVLALELRHGGEHRDAVRTAAAIIAAQFAGLMRSSDAATAVDRKLA